MTDKTGGPAFPSWSETGANFTYGMTLRDYFAAKAMQGLIAADTGFTMPALRIAELAYEQADAMMEARK